jgi:amidase
VCVTKNEGSGIVADVAVAFELEEETISSLREKLSSKIYFRTISSIVSRPY